MQNNFDLILRAIQLQNERLLRELEEVRKMLEEKPSETIDVEQEFLTLEQCWRIKGGCSLNTFKANPLLRVGCGNPKYSHYIKGRLCFKKQDVYRWKNVEDGQDFLDYARECGITVIPEKYLRFAQKAIKKTEVLV